MVNQTEQTWIKATRFYAGRYAERHASQCSECKQWVYADEGQLPFEVLAIHLQKYHLEIQEKLVREFKRP